MSIVSNAKPLEIPSDPAEINALIVKQHNEIQNLTQQLAYLKRMVFGQKRERFVPAVPEEQMALEELFETAGTKIPGFAESKEKISYERRKQKKGDGRNPIPDDLHREKHILTFLKLKKSVPAAVRKRNISATTSPKNLNINRRSFLLTNMFVRNTHVPSARTMALRQRQCLLALLTRALQVRGCLPIFWSANTSTICRYTV
jgi:hypothetical protein